MNVAILLGRGIEGAGVTKFAEEFRANYGKTVIFATDDKKWPRKKLQPISAVEFTCANEDSYKAIVEYINNNIDIVLIFSVPSKKHPQACIDNFVELIKQIKCKKGVLQLDHNMASISRNARLDDITTECDVALSYTLNTDFCRWCKKRNVDTPIVEMNISFNFDAHRKKFWKPIDQQRNNVIRWIGRLAGWKGPELMADFHNDYLREKGVITILEGLEAGVWYKNMVFKDTDDPSTRRPAINKFRPDSTIGEDAEFTHGEETGGNLYLYPPYDWNDCMDRMSVSGFGAELYHLRNARMYGTHVEYCQAEIIACGAIPIFHGDFGKNVYHRITGNPVIEDADNGTLFLDDTEESKIIVTNQILDLIKYPMKRDEWREKAYEYWKSHFNARNTYLDVVNSVYSA